MSSVNTEGRLEARSKEATNSQSRHGEPKTGNGRRNGKGKLDGMRLAWMEMREAINRIVRDLLV